MASATPHRADGDFALALFRPRGICRTGGKIAAVCVEIQFTDFRAYDSTPLSLDADRTIKTRGLMMAMGGDDDVARNGGESAKGT